MAPSKKTATTSKATPSFTTVPEVAETAPVVECEAEAVPCEAAAVSDVTSGRVKWFNNKAGYGFITVNDCETNEERDLFVHHSEIRVLQTQYKYLVQGEYASNL
jgi:cold shock CspA family protein